MSPYGMAQLDVPVRLKIRGSNKYTALFILYYTFTFSNFTLRIQTVFLIRLFTIHFIIFLEN